MICSREEIVKHPLFSADIINRTPHDHGTNPVLPHMTELNVFHSLIQGNKQAFNLILAVHNGKEEEWFNTPLSFQSLESSSCDAPRYRNRRVRVLFVFDKQA